MSTVCYVPAGSVCADAEAASAGHIPSGSPVSSAVGPQAGTKRNRAGPRDAGLVAKRAGSVYEDASLSGEH